MTPFPKARECTFLRPDAQIQADLPPVLALARQGHSLQFTMSGNDSPLTLGITRDGLLCGFESTESNDRAAVVVQRKPEGGFAIFRATETPSLPVERIYEPSGDFGIPYGLKHSKSPQRPIQSAPKVLQFGGNGISAGIMGGWL